jgi:hypothetical protein
VPGGVVVVAPAPGSGGTVTLDGAGALADAAGGVVVLVIASSFLASPEAGSVALPVPSSVDWVAAFDEQPTTTIRATNERSDEVLMLRRW